ncbi:unnamed protein product [Tetraodon nigroviridis]|uniref:(spotted green pufferfish) hypothetical protein n=1 Tax=Tetraodon nigroviridis TaxID=99883 RepID=Q4RE57_TETNG|nr:unnamed protein product [Tetraodon nigroviridis]
MTGSNEYKLNQGPEDSISAVKFSPSTAQFLLVSSWDSTVRLYDVVTNTIRMKYQHTAPVLDCAFYDPAHSWSGGLDAQLKTHDLNTDQGAAQFCHRCFKNVSIHMNRACLGLSTNRYSSWHTRRPYSMCGILPGGECHGNRQLGQIGSAVGSQDSVQRWYLYPARKGVHALCGRRQADRRHRRKTSSGLGFEEHGLRTAAKGVQPQGYVLSSIEGRVAVEYLDPSQEVQKKKYAFKCHRLKEDGIEHVYPVNAISFHSVHNTFATGGSDGFVNIWDPFNKKRLCQFHRYPTSIASLAFNNDGTMLAIASSYMQEKGDISHPEDAIFIRQVTDAETKPKST